MSTKKLVRTGMFLAVALVFQIGFRQFAQPLVGPLVNMTLILATLIIGPVAAILVGTVTPLVAFVLGIIGVPFLVPIVAVGNAVMILCFYFAKKLIKHKLSPWIGIGLASLFKFLFLAMSVRLLLPLVMPKVPDPVIAAFSLPQLTTALVGGVIAIVLYKILPPDSDWL